MTKQMVLYGILGLVSIGVAFRWNGRLFGSTSTAGRTTLLEAAFYVFGLASLGLGWYFNWRYTHTYHDASYTNYTKMLFTNWAADSAAQDYIMVNVILLPLWSIIDGRRRSMRVPWIFFVMSLFTSLAFSMAMYLAFVERQNRYNAAATPANAPTATAAPAPSAPRLEHGIPGVVPGNESDTGSTMAPRPT